MEPFRNPSAFLGTTALVLGVLAPSSVTAQEPHAPIPWHANVAFSRTSVDDDVRNVLRAILAADGLSVIFRPEVSGKVSFSFRDMSLRAAFDQVLVENDLHATYTPDTRTVLIAGGVQDAENVRHFITLRNVEWPSLQQMLTSFGIGTDGVVFDASTSLLDVTGTPEHVAQIEDLVKTLEQHYGEQREDSFAETQRSVDSTALNVQRRLYSDALSVETKVFRLRFADVAPTTRAFHGQTVTVPGILETLQAMLGSNGQNPPFATARAERAGFRPASAGVSASRQALSPIVGVADAGGEPDLKQDLPGNAGPTISIDQRTNSVIVRGTPTAIAAVADVIRQLDQPVKMVEIEVIIATAELDVVNQLGLTYRGLTDGSRLGVDTGTSGTLLGSASSSTTGALLGEIPAFNALTLLPQAAAGGAAASFVLGGRSNALQAQLQALAEQNKVRVLSAPRLVTLDNITARITRSEDIYVPVDTGGLNGQGLSEIQTGLTLEITPSIVPAAAGSSDQLVRLTLDATNSAPGSGTGNQINVESQEVQTDVLVPNGSTYVIGGLFDDSRLKSRSGVPILKDIPVLGGLFRSDSAQQSLGQTIFFITPHVVDQEQLVDRAVAIGESTKASMDAARRQLDATSRELGGVQEPRSASLEEDQ